MVFLKNETAGMLQVTKIFRFETAHAIHGYPGPCGHIHGHSYVLHVTVACCHPPTGYLPRSGFVMDFRELKELVNKSIIGEFDHRTILSEEYLHGAFGPPFEKLAVWKMEPTAENMLLYIRDILRNKLPPNIRLRRLKLYETCDSYAVWEPDEE
jgi:6-pyruvoyltetrahydropterin/6-carboxytetrahydropterin synthase